MRLEGTMHRPGRTPREVRVELSGRAISPERVEAAFTEPALSGLGGRGTLRGHARVLFATADRRGAVTGRSPPTTVDVTPSSTQRVSDAVADGRRAAALVDRLGLALDDEPSERSGLPIREVAEGSVAARAGLVEGDRLVEANGVRAHALADLLPPPGAERLALRIARRGEAAPFAVALPVHLDRSGLAPETVRAAQLAVGWVLLVLLWLAPTAGVADWLGRRVRRSRRARVEPPGDAPRLGFVRRVLRRHGRGLGRLALAVTLFATIPVAHRAGLLRVPLEALVLAAFALRASSAWLAAHRRPTRQRLLDLAHASAGVLCLAVALTAVAALGGTTDLSALQEPQGAAPWTWTLLRTPLGPLALGVLLIGGGTAPEALARGDDPQARLARGLDDAVLAAVAAAAAAVLLGGWGPASATGAPRVAFALLYVICATLLFSWMRRGRRLGRPTRPGVVASALLALGLIAGVAAHIAWEPPAALERGLAQVVGGAALLLGATVLGRLLAGRVRARAEPSHPFL